jgi:archaellum component FlaG (FlaF/FlaG flagellin family)
MLEGRYAILLLIVAVLISGAVAAGMTYWAATTYLTSQHSEDPLQRLGDLRPSQKINRK